MAMRSFSQVGRVSALVAFGVAAAEVLIMISPFAGFFYSNMQFEPLLGVLSRSPVTAWLDGFFLSHSVVTTSLLLEWHRKVGLVLFVLGLCGFFLSVFQVYGNKIMKRGVARGFLYRFVRHPQYLCLGIAGWGLLTQWPRFMLLGIWVTMLFLYVGLARSEERRMEERFGEDYRRFAQTRGAFLPGSPIHRLFEATFGRLRPRTIRWVAAYVFCLALAFSLGFTLRAYTRASTVILWEPRHHTVVVSAWPKPEKWMANVFQAALRNQQVRQLLEKRGGEKAVVATILSPEYGMKGMYYTIAADQRSEKHNRGPMMGVDPDSTDKPVEVVFSQAEKPYRAGLALNEALDVDVRLTPLLVVNVIPRSSEATGVRIPLPQNAWGPNVIMPLF